MSLRRRRSRSRSPPTQDLDIRFTITTYEGHVPLLIQVNECPQDIQILLERRPVQTYFRFLDTRSRKVLVTLNIENSNGWPRRFDSVDDLFGESRLSVNMMADRFSEVVIDGRRTVAKTYRIRVPAAVRNRVARAARATAEIDSRQADEILFYPPFDRHGGAQ